MGAISNRTLALKSETKMFQVLYDSEDYIQWPLDIFSSPPKTNKVKNKAWLDIIKQVQQLLAENNIGNQLSEI